MTLGLNRSNRMSPEREQEPQIPIPEQHAGPIPMAADPKSLVPFYLKNTVSLVGSRRTNAATGLNPLSRKSLDRFMVCTRGTRSKARVECFAREILLSINGSIDTLRLNFLTIQQSFRSMIYSMFTDVCFRFRRSELPMIYMGAFRNETSQQHAPL